VRSLARREKALLGLLALILAALGVWALQHPESAPRVLSRAKAEPPPAPVPRIDLARLDAPHPDNDAGRRDLFDYGAAEATDVPTAATAPPIVGPPPASTPTGGAPEDLRAATLPPLNLWYIGSVESARGIKVAVLVTDRREVLTGQAGQTVANRYRIARIGLESVDLEDLSSGQSRRIPLRGN
jgi:hypothetical protein